MRTAQDFEIIDIHHHAGSAGSFFGGEAELSAEEDIRKRLALMDRHGMDAALLMPGSGSTDIASLNDYAARCRDLCPARFPGAIGTVNPLDGKAAIRELDRCILQLGMKGMVWHHWFSGVPLDHPAMLPIFARMQELGVPAFVHIVAQATLESPWRLERMADRHPDLTFVALDAFSSADHVNWMFYIAGRHPNIRFDTAVMMSLAHRMEDFIEAYGAERVMLGTDTYSEPQMYNVAFPIVELLASRLSDDDLRKVFSGNIRDLLKLPAPEDKKPA